MNEEIEIKNLLIEQIEEMLNGLSDLAAIDSAFNNIYEFADQLREEIINL